MLNDIPAFPAVKNLPLTIKVFRQRDAFFDFIEL